MACFPQRDRIYLGRSHSLPLLQNCISERAGAIWPRVPPRLICSESDGERPLRSVPVSDQTALSFAI